MISFIGEPTKELNIGKDFISISSEVFYIFFPYMKVPILHFMSVNTAYCVILNAFLLSAVFFFKINFFEKFFQEYHQCHTVWIQIRPNMLSADESLIL